MPDFQRAWVVLHMDSITAAAAQFFGRGVQSYKSHRGFCCMESNSKVSKVRILVRTGRKWGIEETFRQAGSRLQHSRLVGFVKRGRASLGCFSILWPGRDLEGWWEWSNKGCRKDGKMWSLGGWLGSSCEKLTLDNILSSCSEALGEGHHPWRHDQVLKDNAEAISAEAKGSTVSDLSGKQSPSSELGSKTLCKIICTNPDFCKRLEATGRPWAKT